MRASDKQATAELLIAIIEAAIARGRRHYSERGELLARRLRFSSALQREGFVTAEAPSNILRTNEAQT